MSLVPPPARAAPDTVVARRLRGRGAGLTRHDVLAALDTVDGDTGLPRAAVLAVRRLDLAVAGDPPRVAGAPLRRIAADAHRVSDGPPPTDCDAVLFADEVELLVALAGDVAAGRPLGWWWATVLGPAFGQAAVRGRAGVVSLAWQEHAHALPAAMALAPTAMTAAASELPTGDLLVVLGQAARLHGAERLGSMLLRVGTAVTATGSAPAGGAPIAIGPLVDTLDTPGASSELLVAPPSSAARNQVVALMVEVARTLHRRPMTVRSAEAVEALGARLVEALMPAPTPHGGRTEVPPVDRSPVASTADAPGAAGSPAELSSGLVPVLHTSDALDSPDSAVDDTGDPARTIVTRWGGAFYLLNLLDALDLPASACGPAEPGHRLDRWGILGLLVAAMAPDPESDLVDLLAELSTMPVDDDTVGGVHDHDGDGDGDGENAVGVDRWIGDLVGVLDERLRSVDVDIEALAVPATVTATAITVTARFSIDDIDPTVRRAGLDRDPGWVPALGRVVELVFA